jgi:dodecin
VATSVSSGAMWSVTSSLGTSGVVVGPGMYANAPLGADLCHGRASTPAGGGIVTDHVYRLTEVVGSSETSVAEAIRTAVRKASQTVRNIEWFEAKEIRGQVVDGDVAYFQVTVKLGFRVD